MNYPRCVRCGSDNIKRRDLAFYDYHEDGYFACRSCGYEGTVWQETKIAKLKAEIERYEHIRKAVQKDDHTIEQALGKALGYPWFVKDPKNFPDATEEDGVCVGEHVPATIAIEAAERIMKLEAELAKYRLKWQTGKMPKNGWYWTSVCDKGIWKGPWMWKYESEYGGDKNDGFNHPEYYRWSGPIPQPEEE
jgi:hypothetical protein